MQTSNLLRCRIAIVLWIVAHCNGSVVDVDSCSLHSIEATARDRVEWTKFVSNYGKLYTSPTERQRRFEIFQQNLCLARRRNRAEEGTAVFGVTVFSDHEESEFQKTRLNAKTSVPLTSRTFQPNEPLNDHLPSSFDWRDHNAVTAVKDQGACGSCCAFSTTGNVESVWSVGRNVLQNLSQEQLIECAPGLGCFGGQTASALSYALGSGMQLEDQHISGKCNFTKSSAAVHIDGWVELPSDERKIAQFLMKNGAVSVAIDGRHLQHYTGGIVRTSDEHCGKKKETTNHAVLLVGFGHENGLPFWIVKNSWGQDWGEAGYFRLFRGENVCAVASMVTSAIII